MSSLWGVIRHPPLPVRLQLIVACALLSLLVLGGLAAVEQYNVMWEARVEDLSEGGARVVGGPVLSIGARGSVTVDGMGFPLPFIVRGMGGGKLHLGFDVDAETRVKLASIVPRHA